MASNEARLEGDVDFIEVQVLAERIATLARARLADLVMLTTTLLDNDETDPLTAEVKQAVAAYATKFFDGFEADVVLEIRDHIHATGGAG
jgi:hypothetical protein